MGRESVQTTVASGVRHELGNNIAGWGAPNVLQIALTEFRLATASCQKSSVSCRIGP